MFQWSNIEFYFIFFRFFWKNYENNMFWAKVNFFHGISGGGGQFRPMGLNLVSKVLYRLRSCYTELAQSNSKIYIFSHPLFLLYSNYVKQLYKLLLTWTPKGQNSIFSPWLVENFKCLVHSFNILAELGLSRF